MYIAGALSFAVAVSIGFVLHLVGRRARKVDLGVVSNQWINEQRTQTPTNDR
jgi:hypothetical protein